MGSQQVMATLGEWRWVCTLLASVDGAEDKKVAREYIRKVNRLLKHVQPQEERHGEIGGEGEILFLTVEEGRPFTLLSSTLETVTHLLPLVDENRKMFGVLTDKYCDKMEDVMASMLNESRNLSHFLVHLMAVLHGYHAHLEGEIAEQAEKPINRYTADANKMEAIQVEIAYQCIRQALLEGEAAQTFHAVKFGTEEVNRKKEAPKNGN